MLAEPTTRRSAWRSRVFSLSPAFPLFFSFPLSLSFSRRRIDFCAARRDAAAFPRRSVSYTYTATYTYVHTYRIVLSALRIRRAARLCVIQIDRLRPLAPSSISLFLSCFPPFPTRRLSLSLSFPRRSGNHENAGLSPPSRDATTASNFSVYTRAYVYNTAATPPLISLIDNGRPPGARNRPPRLRDISVTVTQRRTG